jgi:hypothetical protein
LHAEINSIEKRFEENRRDYNINILNQIAGHFKAMNISKQGS